MPIPLVNVSANVLKKVSGLFRWRKRRLRDGGEGLAARSKRDESPCGQEAWTACGLCAGAQRRGPRDFQKSMELQRQVLTSLVHGKRA